MARFVALLRGINVGGNRVIKMADLRDMVAAIGGRDVETYIQSGNVVFAHAARSTATLTKELSLQIAKTAGFDVSVVVRTGAELAATVAANPFTKAAPEHLHVMFMAAKPPAGVLGKLDVKAFLPEQASVVERDVYLHLPNGMGRSKLAAAVTRIKALADGTARNWRTVETLTAMATAKRSA